MAEIFPFRPFGPVRGGIDRRTLLKSATAAGLLTAAAPLLRAAPARAEFKTNPFTLGIASGDPSPDGFVVWTRLAPAPLEIDGGMGDAPVEVAWQVARDPAMTQVVREGAAVARVELAHSVHVELDGLEPGRDYFYRFRSGDAESMTGRARTLPAAGSAVGELRFAAAGCQQWEGGYYTAWRGIAEDQLDFVFHYGDYIYERAYSATDRQGHALARVMPQDFPVCMTLTDYRRRYALYKSDLDLQAAHAACAFVSSFDDHEVADNWASASDPKNTPAEAFLVRRAAAFQAWYEHMPVRRAQMPYGPDVQAYRRFSVGRLADVAVLDTRQYRSKQPCGDGFKAHCAEADEAARTMMGTRQEAWLADGLRESGATWQVLAQQVLFSHFDWRSLYWVTETEAPAVDLDAWDGASAARARMLKLWREARVANPVVLSGDMHRGLALELRDDGADPSSPCLGVEFLATSIASGGDGAATLPNAGTMYANNPHLKYISEQRGYHRHTVTPRQWQADFRVVDRISTPGLPVTTAKTLVVEAGKPGLAGA
jgi:alkaline phosphatase D